MIIAVTIITTQLKSNTINLVRNINNALGKNRRILEGLFIAGEEMAKISRDKLLQKGFQFKYITHTYTNKKGKFIFFATILDIFL